ncbi:MAG: molybdate ABC transporter substrate-binding protein, partial [Candidatus Eisenbacteria bacterium]|nr:molybdate ABC transporter substrate-binding protein [Candidatus Eisenbacteria bacterium]
MQAVRLACLGILVALLVSACGADDRPALIVHTASSLADALEEIAATAPELNVKIKPGGSGQLAASLNGGAPGDLFFSAHPQWVDELIYTKVLEADSRTTICGNRMVLIRHRDAGAPYATPQELAKSPRIALGDPDSVPAGHYAWQTLVAWQLTKDIDDRMTTTPSARIALALVEKKAADAGFVYESDALRSDQVRVDLVIDPKYHEEIRYTGSIVSRSTQKENAKK